MYTCNYNPIINLLSSTHSIIYITNSIGIQSHREIQTQKILMLNSMSLNIGQHKTKKCSIRIIISLSKVLKLYIEHETPIGLNP